MKIGDLYLRKWKSYVDDDVRELVLILAIETPKAKEALVYEGDRIRVFVLNSTYDSNRNFKSIYLLERYFNGTPVV